MRIAMIGLGFATLSVVLFAIVAFLGLNGGWTIAATALFSSAIACMAGLIYGIVNDMFATTKANLPYFLLGYQETQHSLFISNDPKVQAIGWGIIAAQPIAVIASLVFGITIAVAIAIVTLGAALTYVSVNKEKQIDNRYKLFTDGYNGQKKMDELYVPELNY